jgi:hypothetical protein
MGVATALVRAWEDGSGQPNARQLEFLAKILRFDQDEINGFPVRNL